MGCSCTKKDLFKGGFFDFDNIDKIQYLPDMSTKDKQKVREVWAAVEAGGHREALGKLIFENLFEMRPRLILFFTSAIVKKDPAILGELDGLEDEHGTMTEGRQGSRPHVDKHVGFVDNMEISKPASFRTETVCTRIQDKRDESRGKIKKTPLRTRFEDTPVSADSKPTPKKTVTIKKPVEEKSVKQTDSNLSNPPRSGKCLLDTSDTSLFSVLSDGSCSSSTTSLNTRHSSTNNSNAKPEKPASNSRTKPSKSASRTKPVKSGTSDMTMHFKDNKSGTNSNVKKIKNEQEQSTPSKKSDKKTTDTTDANTLDAKSLLENEKMMDHVTVVVESLGKLVGRLNDEPVFAAYMIKMQHYHDMNKAYKRHMCKDDFRVMMRCIDEAFLKVLTETLYSAARRQATRHFLEIAYFMISYTVPLAAVTRTSADPVIRGGPGHQGAPDQG